MKANTGRCPREAQGKRVVVQLRNGRVCGREPLGPALPSGWAADGKNGCRWTLTDSPFDVASWEIAK